MVRFLCAQKQETVQTGDLHPADRAFHGLCRQKLEGDDWKKQFQQDQRIPLVGPRNYRPSPPPPKRKDGKVALEWKNNDF